jgi:transposase-like protein
MVMTSFVSGRHAEPVTEPAEPEVAERANRRTYSAQYKLRILAEYERRDRDGKGALLRREGLYTSLISEWRKQRDHRALQALAGAPGRPPVDRPFVSIHPRRHVSGNRAAAARRTPQAAPVGDSYAATAGYTQDEGAGCRPGVAVEEPDVASAE